MDDISYPVGFFRPPSEKRLEFVSFGMIKFPIDGEIKDVPNHQPARIMTDISNLKYMRENRKRPPKVM